MNNNDDKKELIKLGLIMFGCAAILYIPILFIAFANGIVGIIIGTMFCIPPVYIAAAYINYAHGVKHNTNKTIEDDEKKEEIKSNVKSSEEKLKNITKDFYREEKIRKQEQLKENEIDYDDIEFNEEVIELEREKPKQLIYKR